MRTVGSNASNIGKHFIHDPKVKGLVGVSPKWEEAGPVKQGSESPMNHLVKKYVDSSLLCFHGTAMYFLPPRGLCWVLPSGGHS